MSTVLLTARHEVAYHGASGRKEVYAIFDQQSVRGLHGGPDLFWLAYEPGQFILKLVYEPASLVPDEVQVYGKYDNYLQAKHALLRIQAELQAIVEQDQAARRSPCHTVPLKDLPVGARFLCVAAKWLLKLKEALNGAA